MKTNMRPSLARSQILHELRPHHAGNLYSNLTGQPVIKQIESSNTPSKKYKDMVKEVLMDELQSSLKEYEERKLKNNEKSKEFGRSYLDDCQRNKEMIENSIRNRKHYYELINKQQNDRAQEFIDATKVHENRVLDHVDTNYDPKVFHHFQEEYQQKMAKTKQEYKDTLDKQLQRKERIQSQHKQNMENQIETRLKLLQKIHILDMRDRNDEKTQKVEYKNDLDKLVEFKSSQNRTDKSPFYDREERHNPITNPIEYHVDNPYILKKYVKKTYNNPII